MIRGSGVAQLGILMLAACGSTPGVTGDGSAVGGGDGTFATCATDNSVPPYMRGMSVVSSPAPGTFMVKLVESAPGPPVKGQNTWTIEVDEVATGLPLDGLIISVVPYMPSHMHGTTTVGVTPVEMDGPKYVLKPVYLYMSGIWEVRFEKIAAPMLNGGITETAMIPVCIP